MNNTTNTILKYSIIIGLVLIAFIPLYVGNSLFFPFITGKAFAFRIIVEIIFALWIILVFREKGNSIAGTDKSVAPRINALTITVSVFTIIVLIADLLGMNPLRSIWSNFERMEGWITIVHLWAYFIVLSSIFGNGKVINSEGRKNWHLFLNVILFAGFITAIYGLFQYLGLATVHQSSSRLDASLGNAAYMAVYMLMIGSIAGYMIFSKTIFSYKRHINAFILSSVIVLSLSYIHNIFVIAGYSPTLFLIIYLLALFASLFISPYSTIFVFSSYILFQTATRGSVLGWIAGIIIACLFYIIFGRSKIEHDKQIGQSNKSRLIISGIIALFIIIGILFYFNRDASFIKDSQTLSRLASISMNEIKTQGRAYIWPMAIEGGFENIKTILIGRGQENFNYIFNEKYNPLMFGHEQWFDRAHSVYLDWFIAGGILTLGLYLVLYIISIIYIIKSDFSIAQKSVLLGLIFAYGIHNVFVFDNQTSYVMFFTILAFLSSTRSDKKCKWLSSSDPISEDYRTVLDYIIVPVIIIGIGIAFYFINIRIIQANLRLMIAVQNCSNSNSDSYKLFDKALILNQTTSNQEAREQLLFCAQNQILNTNIPIKSRKEIFDLTQKHISNQISEAPLDARMYVIAGSFYNSIRDYATALPLLQKALELTPGKQSVKFDIAVNYMNTNKPNEAVSIAKEAYESAKEYEQAKIAYIITLINNNEENKAKEIFSNNPELFTDQRIVNVYIQRKEYSKVIDIYKKEVEKDAQNAQKYFYLVGAYLYDDQIWNATQTLKLIKEKFPYLKDQVDSYLKLIEEGKNPIKDNK